MKQVNFNSLRQIKAPEELITRTLTAARESEGETAAPVFVPSRRRRLAVAASVVLVLGVSIAVYFSIRNIKNTPPLVAPMPESTDAASEAGEYPTEGRISPTVPQATDHPAEQPTAGAAAPSSPDSTETQQTAPTIRPTAPTVTPTVTPTQAPTEPVTAPTELSVIPTQAPTAPSLPPVIEPTEAYTEPPEPWVPPYENPTESEWTDPHPGEIPSLPDGPVTLCSTFDSALLTGSKKVYCAIYEDGVHELIGGDRFSPAHEARIVGRDGIYVTAEYEIPGSLFPGWKMYRVQFYNEDGKTVDASGRYLP